MIDFFEIRWFRFKHPLKRRPVLILGLPGLLPSLSQVPVIPISSQIRGLDWEVLLTPADGLPSNCVLKPEWITCVDKTEIGPFIAKLSTDRVPEVRNALIKVLGLE